MKYLSKFPLLKLCMLLFSLLMLQPEEAEASHFRYGNITWERVSGQPYQIRFRVTQAWRRSAFSNPNTGATVNTGSMNTGSGSQSILLTVTSINVAEDWFYGEYTFIKTYPSVNTNYTASFGGCCRIGSPLVNNSGGNFLVSSIVTVGNNNDAPVSTVPPFISLPVNTAAATYQIPAADPNNDAITFSLTPNNSFGSGTSQPSGISISSGGLLTFNTVGKSVGQFYSASVDVTDSKGAKIQLDLMIRISAPSTPPVFDYTVTPANSASYVLQPGQSVSFNVKASDNDAGDNVLLNAVGVPVGASFTSGSGNPVTRSFSWTPTMANVGTYQVNFVAQDNAGIQTNTIVNISVSLKPNFVSPSPGTGSIFCHTPGSTITTSFKAEDVDTADRVILSLATTSQSGMNFSPSLPTSAANPVSSNFTWNTTTANWGINTVVIRAKDNYNETRDDSVFYIINNPPAFTTTQGNATITAGQTFSYTFGGTDANIAQGDAISLSHTHHPSWMTIVNNGNGTWTLSGTPTLADSGTHSVTLQLQDLTNHFRSTHCGDATQSFYVTVLPCNITTNTVVTDVQCSGGSTGAIDLTVNNATAPVSYTWSNNATTEDLNNIAAGTYSVSILDANGCTAADTAVVSTTYQLTTITNCPSNISVNATTGNCNAAVNYTTTATGATTPTYSYVLTGATTGNGSGTGSGENFNVGVTNVMVIASDICGNDTCMFTITVADNQPPQLIGVPGNASASCDAVPSAANVTASDNCSATVTYRELITTGAMPINNLQGFWMFNEGTGNTTADQSGNGNNGALSSGVNWVAGQSGNAIQLPGSGNVYVEIPNGTGGKLDAQYSISMFAWYWPGTNGSQQNPIIQYNANGWGTHLWQTGSNQLFVRFTQRNTLAFTNALAANSLVPNQWNCVGATYDYNTGVATLWCNGVAVASQNIGQMQLSTNYPVRIGSVNFDGRRTNSKVDNVAIYDRVLTSTEISTLCVATCPQNYTITRVWTAKDAANNTTTASQAITVSDTTRPVLTIPANITVNAANGQCSEVVTFQATATDNCSSNLTISYSQNPGSAFPVGITTVTVTAKDECGNTSTGTFDVTVMDNQNPTITCPADVTVNADNGSCAATNVNLGTPTTGDNCGVQGTSNNGLNNYPVGTTVVTWTVTDIHGNSATCNQNVTVVDNQNPTIACPADVTVNADNGSCAATNVNLGTPTTGDNCGVQVTSNNGLSSYPVGTTVVTWTVTDIHGNSTTCNQNVTVVDNQNPTISIVNVTVNADNGACAATNVNLGTPTTGDNCGVSGTSNDGITSYPVGTTTVTWTVTDIHGNTGTTTQTVTVIDNQNPTIACPVDVTVNADNGSCAATNVNLGTPTTGDNCGVQGTSNNGLSSYPVGTTVVTWTVTDIHGNSATCAQNVTVVDNQAPAASCKPYTLNLSGGTGTVSASDVDNNSTDNCGIASMSVSPNTFTCANAGENTVVLTVTDIHGNSSTCTTTVTVQYQPTCSITTTPSNNTYTGGNPNNIYLGYGPQSATITANATGGTGFTYSWSPAANLSCTNCQSPVFTPTAAGNYTYTVTVTNSNGCATTCTVSFCVLDIRVPGKGNNNKVYLCHVPPGNNNNPQTLSVSVNAVASHLSGHSGDRLGSCNMSCGSSAKGGRGNGEEGTEEGHEHSIEELVAENGITVYPNPNNGLFTLNLPTTEEAQILISNVSGQVVYRNNVSGTQKVSIDLSNKAQGIYMIQVVSGANTYHTRVNIQL